MTIDIVNLKAMTFGRQFKQLMTESLDRKLNDGEAFDLLPNMFEADNSGAVNKKNFLKSTVSAYEMDFKDAAKDKDPDIKERGKQALAMVSKLKKIPDSKFENGVPGAYENFLASMFSYVCGLTDKMPVLKEDIDIAITDDYLAELYEGADEDEISVLSEHVRSDAISIDWTKLNPEEKEVVIRLKEQGRQLGSDPGAYASGVLRLTFKNKQAVIDFTNAIEDDDAVDTFEIEAYKENLVGGYVEQDEYDFDDIMFDKDFEFDVFVYLIPELVSEDPFELEVGDDFEYDDENVEYISEVRRRIKINFRGKKKIKMQCRRGFKWVAAKKSCVKITGAEVALKRKAMRRMVRTKKAKGASFKARVLRKTRKAKRFRKSMGVKSFSWSGMK